MKLRLSFVGILLFSASGCLPSKAEKPAPPAPTASQPAVDPTKPIASGVLPSAQPSASQNPPLVESQRDEIPDDSVMTRPECKTMFITTPILNFRKDKNVSSEVLFQCPSGSAVTVTSIVDGWAVGTVAGQKGFFSTKYLSCTDPSGGLTECKPAHASEPKEKKLVSTLGGKQCEPNRVCGDFSIALRSLCVEAGGGPACCVSGSTRWSESFFLSLAKSFESGKRAKSASCATIAPTDPVATPTAKSVNPTPTATPAVTPTTSGKSVSPAECEDALVKANTCLQNPSLPMCKTGEVDLKPTCASH